MSVVFSKIVVVVSAVIVVFVVLRLNGKPYSVKTFLEVELVLVNKI